MLPQLQLLPQADGAEGVDAGPDRLAAAQQRQARAAAADLGKQGPLAVEPGLSPECWTARKASRLSSASLMMSNAIPVRRADAIEKGVAVARLAHGAGRHGPHLLHAVAVDDAPEPLQRGQRGIGRARPDGGRRERVAAEQHGARGVLGDADRRRRRQVRRRPAGSRSRPCRARPRAADSMGSSLGSTTWSIGAPTRSEAGSANLSDRCNAR